MSRPGLTYKDVVDAAMELQAQGLNPTIERIRKLTRTGSNGTIAPHLRSWKNAQVETSKIASQTKLPEALVVLVDDLWKQVACQTEIQVASLEEAHQKVVLELQGELQKYKNNNQRWQQLYNQWLEEQANLAAERLTLEQALAFAQKENISLHIKQDALIQQLQERQERIEELHRYHQQAQANLEHYRESARQQRVLDQEQFEQQKQDLQSELKNIKEHTSSLCEKILSTQHQYLSLEKTHQNLEQSHAKTILQFEKQQEKIVELEKVKHEGLQMSQLWQSQCKELQQVLESKATQLIDIQTKVDVLSEQLFAARKFLEDATDKNRLLDNEKWKLTQENAQLQGQLKQIQKMIDA